MSATSEAEQLRADAEWCRSERMEAESLRALLANLPPQSDEVAALLRRHAETSVVRLIRRAEADAERYGRLAEFCERESNVASPLPFDVYPTNFRGGYATVVFCGGGRTEIVGTRDEVVATLRATARELEAK
jgi:hypothetical protein